MNAEAEYDQVVSALYDAALQPERWPQAFAALTRHSGADFFHFLRWDADSGSAPFNLHSDGVEGAIAQYGLHFGTIDPRRLQLDQAAEGQVVSCQRHFDARYVARSAFYQEFLLPWGGHRTMSSVVLRQPGSQMLLGLVRASDRDAFADDEIARCQRVVPHVARACRLWLRGQALQTAADMGGQAAAATGLAVIGLDERGRVVHANAPAERLLQAHDSLFVKAGGRLAASHADDAARLRQAVTQVLAGEPAEAFPVAGLQSGPQACFLSIARLPADAPLVPLLGQARVLVLARQRGQHAPLTPAQLARLFGLTPAEAGVALALLDGKTPEQYAHQTQLSMPTVRTQLRAVFAKTQTRGQVEAVQLLQGLPAST